MLTVCTEPLSVEHLGCWGKHTDRITLIAGYTAFGDVFLLDPDTEQYAVLCPLSGQRFPTDCYGNEMFQNQFLTDPGIVERFGRPNDLAVLEERLGALEQEHVFFPVPYPFVGGSGELSSYEKGQVWAFIHLAGLFQGLGE